MLVVSSGFFLTVTTGTGKIHTHGLYIGKECACFEEAVSHAQATKTFVDAPLKKALVFLYGGEFKSTWLGNKSVYRRAWRLPTAANLSGCLRAWTNSAKRRD
jgi:hypothetical protein